MRGLSADWQAKGLDQAFQLRIGINTGYCTVGNFGSEDRMDYTVIGNDVNLAARLESYADVGGIMLSNATWSLVRDEIAAEVAGEISLKGVPRPVNAFRVTESLDELSNEKASIRDAQRALRNLRTGKQATPQEIAETVSAVETALASLREAG